MPDVYLFVTNTGWDKNGPFLKVYNSAHDEVGRRSVNQNVQLFIRSDIDILNVTVFKYSLHKFRETMPACL